MADRVPTNGSKKTTNGRRFPQQVPLWSGQHQVLTRDITIWMLGVAKLTPAHRGLTNYIIDFNVFDKIRTAKADSERWHEIEAAALVFAQQWLGPGLHANALIALASAAFSPHVPSMTP